MIFQVSSHTREWLWSKLPVALITILFLVGSCRNTETKKPSIEPEKTILLTHQTVKLEILLPPEFKESEVVSSPFSGFRIIDLDDQIYGFVSYKLAKFSSSGDPVALIEENFNYDWENFTSHWEEYLSQRGIEVETSARENLLKKDIWGNYVRIKNFTLKFPGTIMINTLMVGDYAEKTLGRTTPPSTIYSSGKDKRWFDATSYQALLVETLIPPTEATPEPRIIVSFLVVPATKQGTLFDILAEDLKQNSNLCMGSCETHTVEETFSLEETTPVEILFFIKDTPGMSMEINQMPELLQIPLLGFLKAYKIPYKLGIATLSDPYSLKKIAGKSWLENGTDPDDFFKIATTNEVLRNNILQKALVAVTTATENELYSNSSTKVLVLVSDRDDQSVTPGGEPVSLTNIDEYVKLYAQEKILPYGIIGFSDQSSFFCDSPEPCNILRRLIFLLGGRIVDICSQNRSAFYYYLVRDAMINTSHIILSHSPVKNSIKLKVEDSFLQWGFPEGFFVDSIMKRVIITPPAGGTLQISYKYFQKKY